MATRRPSLPTMSVDLITILDELSFPEQIHDIAQYNTIGKAGSEAEQRKKALLQKATEAGDDVQARKAVVTQTVDELNGALVPELTDREVEGVFNLVASIVLTNFDDKSATPLLEKVCKVLVGPSANAADRTILRYRVLSNIFNSLSATSPNRCVVFRALLNLASNNDDLEVIADALSAVPKWLSEWDIDASAKADVLDSVATKLQAADNGKDAYTLHLTLLRFLSTSTLSGQGSDAIDTKKVAERTVATALSLPHVFQFEELAEIDAVKKLGNEPIGQLLKIFLHGTTQDWHQWCQANAQELSRLNLSQEQLERKIRLLDLANLCSQSVSKEVPYNSIADALKISIDDVEVWAIDVIRAGLVSGKLSQINQSLRVYKSAYRSFGQYQWKLLESRLSTWEKNIANILQTISDTKQNNAAGVPRDVGIPGADAASAKVQQITT